MKVQFWRMMMHLADFFFIWFGKPTRLWHWVFNHWDESEGCGCWRY